MPGPECLRRSGGPWTEANNMHGRAGPCLPKWPGLAGRKVDRLLSPSPLQLFVLPVVPQMLCKMD